MKHENINVIKLNDAFRRSLVGGALVITRGISDLPAEDLGVILAKVRSYDAFTEDSDPDGEHNSGDFDHQGQKVLWEIEYYDPKIEYHCDPEDSEAHRVLKIMLSSEY